VTVRPVFRGFAGFFSGLRGAALAVLFGCLFGLCGFTFYYARGLSYFGNDPKTCMNCHVMRGQFDAWNRSPHHSAAVCNDCHTPHNLAGKYAVKGLNGYHHSRAFTLGGFPDPIRIKTMNASVAEANCIRCHGGMTEKMREKDYKGKVRCASCHRGMGHATN
jgi:cytochrome c nitrite reductase small subunit